MMATRLASQLHLRSPDQRLLQSKSIFGRSSPFLRPQNTLLNSNRLRFHSGLRFCGIKETSLSLRLNHRSWVSEELSKGSLRPFPMATGSLSPAKETFSTDSGPPAAKTAAPSSSAASVLKSLEDLVWDNSFVRELPGDPVEGGPVRMVRNACYSRMPLKMQVNHPKVVAFSPECAETLGIQPSEFERPEVPYIFAGVEQLRGSEPYSQCYGGHQFGHWAGQLGDGRAITLGEIMNQQGERWELQLKGAGKTPYSRHADGLAVLRSSIREFLCSEAMHHLGIPTTRALTLVTTGKDVLRDMFYNGNAKMEPGAVVCRVAPSFLRFGSYQLHASRGGLEKDIVRVLADYTIKHHFPHLLALPEKSSPPAPEGGSGEPRAEAEAGPGAGGGSEEEEREGGGEEGRSTVANGATVGNRYSALLAEVAERTARTIAMWQCVGFTHGVLNTDNMSVLGLTIDYGPFGFVEAFDTQFTPNTTDLPGRRYCFGNQPDVGLWNVVQLAQTLNSVGLLSADEAQVALERYGDAFYAEYNDRMRRKLGLRTFDGDTLSSLLRLMARDKVDFTNLFRALANVEAPRDGSSSVGNVNVNGNGRAAAAAEEASSSAGPLHALEGVLPQSLGGEEKASWVEWLQAYTARIAEDGLDKEERRKDMNLVNPKYVCRNYLCQVAIEAAEKGDFSEVNELLEVLKRPYEDQPGKDKYAALPPEWAARPGVCVLSCSS